MQFLAVKCAVHKQYMELLIPRQPAIYMIVLQTWQPDVSFHCVQFATQQNNA